MSRLTEPITFTIFGKPVAQPRMGEDPEEKINRFGNVYHSKYDPAARQKFEFAAKAHQWKPDRPIEGPTRVDITWYFKRPKSHYGRRNKQPYLKSDAPIWYALLKKNDRDNLDKFVLDALTGAGWFVDDGIICAGELQKKYTDNLQRVEITITSLTERINEHGKEKKNSRHDRNGCGDQSDHAQEDGACNQLFFSEGQ